MNKTENVSIGRKGFICDVDAYELLQDYLARSKDALAGDPDQEEILVDLELSMAGHLHEMSGELVVDKATAQKVVELMGEVQTEHKKKSTSPKSDTTDTEQKDDFWGRLQAAFKKPIKKDKKRAIADGVCAGIGKSLDVDPIWVRLVFVLLTILTQGAFFIVYLVLVFLMNEGTGAPKRKASEVIDDIKSKLTLNDQASLRDYEKVGRSIVVGIGKLIWTVMKVVVCTILVAVSIGWASVLFFMLTNPSQVDVFGGNPGWLGFVAVFSAGLVVLIPLFELLLGLFGLVRTRSRITVMLWSVWALSLIVCAASFANLVPKIRDYLVTQKPKNDFVYIELVGDEIASLCISPLGTCSDSEQILTYEPLCARNMTVYDMDDRLTWIDRGWIPHYETIEYPASEDAYCARLKEVFDRGAMMVARQKLNDRAYVANVAIHNNSPENPQGITVSSDKEYWQFEYLTRD